MSMSNQTDRQFLDLPSKKRKCSEWCSSLDSELTSISTAEIVANSPQFRRKSSIFVDAIHDLPEKADLAPAQLYSTESGRLFHSGRIVIITVGLPARGKTYA